EIDRASGRAVRHRRVIQAAEPSGEAAPVAGSVPESPDRGEQPAPPPPEAPPPEGEGSDEQGVKGDELPSGDMVTLEREDLEALAPEQTRTIEIVEFVELADIDPIYFDRSYYVMPQDEPQAHRAYGLLLGAMEETGRVAVGSFVLRTREHL